LKVVTILGARPQFIKTKIISENFVKLGIREIILHTGQHYDYTMSEVFFKDLELKNPDYNLGINNGSHGAQTGKMLIEIEEILTKENPDIVLVYGDTNSTLAGALSAVKLQIPVAHVEAGLRSYNRKMPEEINRVLTDSISSLLFTPSELSVKNLANEGITRGVHNTGDVMFDIVINTINNIDKKSIMEKYDVSTKNFILCTIHRAENSDNFNNLNEIVSGINALAEKGITILFPIHPRTKKSLHKFGLNLKIAGKIKLIDPVSYSEMLALEANAKIVITDSGGVQKESYYVGTPCLIPRKETEWVELVGVDCSFLTDANSETIFKIGWEIYNQTNENLVAQKNIYGDGSASYQITKIINEYIANEVSK
jgi:UDP-GlcNAc3NAcA epimerase